MCATAIECFWNFWHLGLRSGGGIGDAIPRLSFKYNQKSGYFLKIVFENFNFIICNLILLNIFFGVIVDSFNTMRDKRNNEDNDNKNKCFICNLDRFDIKSGKSFEEHRQEEHHIFGYVYVYLFLSNKNSQEYSAIENYVWNQINLHRTDWLQAAEDEE